VSPRLVDYIAIIGHGKELKPIRPQDGRDVMDPRRLYEAEVLDRFPVQDHPDCEFPPYIVPFCIPEGGLEISQKPALPRLFYFACTGGNGDRMYGACLVFQDPVMEWEIQKQREIEAAANANINSTDFSLTKSGSSSVNQQTSPTTSSTPTSLQEFLNYPPPAGTSITTSTSTTSSNIAQISPFLAGSSSSSSSTQSNRKSVRKSVIEKPAGWIPRCICMLSHYPFLGEYRVFLTELYRLSLTPCALPIERYINNFFEIPLPPLGRVQVRYKLGMLIETQVYMSICCFVQQSVLNRIACCN
jgi:hypothetical protein